MNYSIAGARCAIEDPQATINEVQAWATRHRAEIVVADARAVFGRDHLETAVRHALRAQAVGTMVARSISMETLRYLAAQRQVADAIRVAGIRRGTDRIGVVVLGATRLDSFFAALRWSRDDEVLSTRDKDLEVLGLTPRVAATVSEGHRTDLALERVALLDVMK